jgi:hypothetical protein
VDNRERLNIQAVLGLGDIVNDGASPLQQGNADAAIRLLDSADIPYFLAIGNHDYDGGEDDGVVARAVSGFNQWFGPARYSAKSYYKGNFPAGSNESFYGVLTINGKQYLILVLEYIPRDSSLDWAASIVKANPDKEVIVVTHSFLFVDGTTADRCDTEDKPRSDNDGEQMWDSFVSQYPNIVMVVNGHLTAGLGARRSDPFLNQAAKAAAQSDKLRRQLAPFAAGSENGFGSPVPYPKSDDSFPHRLAGLAAMLGAGLPLHCVALTAPGEYDTHSDQPQALADGLDITAQSLFAFQRDLEARGLSDRVLTLVWSEFGRRGEENGSDGTDHGAAGTAFLIGSRAKGQMIGEFPGLKNLDEDGNLRPTSDFRAVYCALVEQWLGADADAVIPGARSYARPTLLS